MPNIEQIYQTIGVTLTPVGNRWKALCPFHQEKFPSFYVFEDGGFHCFGCGAGGSLQSVMNRLNSEHKFLAPFNDEKSNINKSIHSIFSQCTKDLLPVRKKIPFKIRCKIYDRLDYCWIQAKYAADDPDVSSLKIISFAKTSCEKILKKAQEFST